VIGPERRNPRLTPTSTGLPKITPDANYLAAQIAQRPTDVEARLDLVQYYLLNGKLDLALPHFRLASILAKGNWRTRFFNGWVLAASGKKQEALTYWRAMAQDPEAPAVLLAALAGQESTCGDDLRAAELFDQAGKKDPSLPVYSLLAGLCRLRQDSDPLGLRQIADGYAAGAFKEFGMSTEFQHYLYLVAHDEQMTGSRLKSLTMEWADLQVNRIPMASTAAIPRTARKLRVGLLSGDLNSHVIGLYLLPLIADPVWADTELVLLSTVIKEDEATRSFLRCGVPVHVLPDSDETALPLARSLHLDVAVDLSSHTGGNRLPLMAHRLAPAQLTWLGYPSTTGMTAMDFKPVDPILEPPDRQHDWNTEEPIDFGFYWGFAPPAEVPPLAEYRPDRPIVCSLNFPRKLRTSVLSTWARILREVPAAELHLLQSVATDRVLAQLADDGVDPSRVKFLTRTHRQTYLTYYQSARLNLDTWPYNGHTTSLDAVYMGVPVLTMACDLAVGRAGVSLNQRLGLAELIAHNPDEYVAKAVSLLTGPDLLPPPTELRRRLLTFSSPALAASNLHRCCHEAFDRILIRQAGRSNLPSA
jgi:Glycosyl transferase family 41